MNKLESVIFYIFSLIMVFSLSVYSQESLNSHDSTGKRQGFWEEERELYCKKINKNNDCKIIVMGIEKGLYSFGKKTNLWTILDDKGRLYRQELYDNDTIVILIIYKRGRILSFSKVQFDKELSSEHQKWYKHIDVTFFNKRGVAKKREFKSVDNRIVIERY